MAGLTILVEKAGDAEEIKEYAAGKVKELEDSVQKKLDDAKKSNRDKFYDIYKNHLERSGLVGKGEKYETLQEYIAQHNDDLEQKLNQIDYLIGMNAEHSKQLAAKVNKALDQDIPIKFVKFQGITDLVSKEMEEIKKAAGEQLESVTKSLKQCLNDNETQSKRINDFVGSSNIKFCLREDFSKYKIEQVTAQT